MNLEKAYGLIIEKLTSWLNDLVSLLPNLAVAAIVVILGFFLSGILKRYALKMVRRFSKLETVNRLFASFVYIVGAGIAVFTALDILDLDKAVTSALAGAGIIGLALAFAFQDIATNFISGVFMSFRRPFNVDDLVKINDSLGRIEAINLRDTTIITLQGQRLIIPNKMIFQNAIENFTSTGRRRLDLAVGVSYGDDLQKVKDITLDAVSSLQARDNTMETELFYEEFGDSSINFIIHIWVNATDQRTYIAARSEAIMKIKRAYDAADITIPFPIRTLDFGIKGGKTLTDMQLNMAERGNA